jgi:hypothetical protein
MERTEQCGIPSQADWHSAHFLGNSYIFSEEENAWALSCATYVKECVLRIESEFELDGDLWMHHTPLPEGFHPELDDSNLLPNLGIWKFQMLIGIAQWVCTIGRLDIAFAVSSLCRFSADHRSHHLAGTSSAPFWLREEETE